MNERDRILLAARSRLQQIGVDFTVSGLALQLGISVGALYLQFKSKEELLAALLEEDLVDGQHPLDALTVLMRYLPKTLSDVVKRRVL